MSLIYALFFITLSSLAGCVLRTEPPPTPTSTPVSDAVGWRMLAPGLEQRSYRPGGSPLSELWVLRVDPALYTFRVHYQPGEPLSLNGWQQELPAAVAFINANFFSPEHMILGLLVTDGVVHGQAYQDRGGTFLVQNGQPRIRSNLREPYFNEPLEQAVQAFPMLVLDGQAVYAPSAQERVSRRTVIAQDQQGRVLLMVTPLTGLTLGALSAYLPATDMDIVNALNLDGGGSTLLYVNPLGGGSPLRLPSFDPVPAVLAVYSH